PRRLRRRLPLGSRRLPHRLTFLPAGGGLQTRSGNIIPRMVSKLTLSLRPGRHQKIAHTLIGKQYL
ncbi:hypothetical protein, partial [Escherichia coli]|uniref:hypothetical protein n=1 Tax=Escherichia coli TaxID=562 RepID=UPI00197AD12C